MEITVAVVGVGRQGLCGAHDLAQIPGVSRLLLVDRDAARLDAASRRLAALGVRAELVPRIPNDAAGGLPAALAGARAVLSAVPFGFGPAVCEAAIEAGAHAVDLGGNLAISRAIHALAPRAAARGVVVAPDCGLMPGLGNTLAGALVGELEALGHSGIAVEIRCGGLPRVPKNALGYELVFSFDGLVNEYDGVSVVLRDGALAEEGTLEDLAPFRHPRLGDLECATTSGGTSSAPETFRGRLREYVYRTVRYPGHFAFFRMLKRIGALAPERRAALRALLEPAIVVDAPDDLVFLRADATAASGESRSREILDFRDGETGFTAMERMTAMPAAAVLELALEGRVHPGSIRVEWDLPMDEYFARLGRRGILPARG